MVNVYSFPTDSQTNPSMTEMEIQTVRRGKSLPKTADPKLIKRRVEHNLHRGNKNSLIFKQAAQEMVRRLRFNLQQ